MAAVRKTLKAVLIDLSGTLHIESDAVKGATEALKRLRTVNIAIRFVTNTSKESKKFLHNRLTSMGFEIKQEEIFTSLTAARQLVDKRNIRPFLLLENEALEDFEDVSTDNPNAVVIGLSPSCFHYDKLNSAFRLILDGAPLIAVNKSRYYQRKDGPALGTGAFIAGLEYSTDVKAEVVGKPEESFFLQSIDGLNCSPEETAMIGDDVRDDIGGAQKVGMVGMLVKTGKFREGDEGKIDPSPNFVFSGFPDAVDYILKNMV